MSDHVEVLRRYNRWRRGQDWEEMQDPRVVGDAIDAACDEIERLRAELAACREDAERWRYLRDDGCGFEITVREENEDGYESWVSGYPGAELDAAIDAARKGEGE